MGRPTFQPKMGRILLNSPRHPPSGENLSLQISSTRVVEGVAQLRSYYIIATIVDLRAGLTFGSFERWARVWKELMHRLTDFFV